MGVGAEKILFVVDEHRRLLGTLTDGDARRWILMGKSLHSAVSHMYNENPRVLSTNYDPRQVREVMIKEKIEVFPIVDAEKRLTDVLFWSDFFSDDSHAPKKKIDLPVLIMAGGRGGRLDPFTKIFPKPLIPFGDKPMIETILDRFAQFGCRDFYVSVNYKGDMIKSYFDHSNSGYQVTLIWEEEPTGTAGSLLAATKLIDCEHLFVSNCDVLISGDYVDIYEFHVSRSNDITIVGSVQHVAVPYGVLEMKDGGELERIVEKPEYDFLVNTGFYVIRKECARHIPTDQAFDFPSLIDRVKGNSGKVQIYPVSQRAWTDIGQWQEYKNALYHLTA